MKKLFAILLVAASATTCWGQEPSLVEDNLSTSSDIDLPTEPQWDNPNMWKLVYQNEGKKYTYFVSEDEVGYLAAKLSGLAHSPKGDKVYYRYNKKDSVKTETIAVIPASGTVALPDTNLFVRVVMPDDVVTFDGGVIYLYGIWLKYEPRKIDNVRHKLVVWDKFYSQFQISPRTVSRKAMTNYTFQKEK